MIELITPQSYLRKCFILSHSMVRASSLAGFGGKYKMSSRSAHFWKGEKKEKTNEVQ